MKILHLRITSIWWRYSCRGLAIWILLWRGQGTPRGWRGLRHLKLGDHHNLVWHSQRFSGTCQGLWIRNISTIVFTYIYKEIYDYLTLFYKNFKNTPCLNQVLSPIQWTNTFGIKKYQKNFCSSDNMIWDSVLFDYYS